MPREDAIADAVRRCERTSGVEGIQGDARLPVWTQGDEVDRRDRVLKTLRVEPGTKAHLAKRDTRWSGGGEFDQLSKKELNTAAKEILARGVERLENAQELLWASDRYALLLVFQAMDAAGKDSTIKHVMSGVNPQGVHVVSFGKPSAEELDHDFLWRISNALPERGRIGIFNRSHYEEVVALRVHPEWLESQRLPTSDRGSRFWAQRYEDINAFEHHIDANGTKVLKFFLHVSKDEQKRRFMARLDNPKKTWKFKAADIAERALWDDYMDAFEVAITATSTEWAPWFVVPADRKPVMQAMVAAIVADTIESLDLQWPTVSASDQQANENARRELEAEVDNARKADKRAAS
jgi:PPK2 family polyphosphate:nucleotide phosphotransferase